MCSAPALNAYVLLQADAALTDRDTCAACTDGATPCRVVVSCADASEAWLAGSVPARYRVTAQLVIAILEPIMKISGPCVRRTSRLPDCTVILEGQIP